MKGIFTVILRILCIALTCSMLLCAFPISAAEETQTSETDETAAPEEPKTVKVVFATEDIPQGTRVGNKHLTVKELVNVNLPDNILGSTEEAVGNFAKHDIYAGEYVNSTLLSEEMVVKNNYDVLVKPVQAERGDFVIATDYVRVNTGLEVEYYLQELIDKNPNRTIYFPAGEYVLGSPLSIPADAAYSVSLLLDDGAVIRASDDWRANGELDALICLGGVKPKNDIYTAGSYYSVQGGVLDARDKTDGISVESGRETVIRNICIKNAKTGIDVRKGANNKSSDCDFEDITIIGSNKPGSVGIDIVAYDNTFTTIRIYNMRTGLICKGGGHIKDIYVINTQPEKVYVGTVGFISAGTFVSNCYVENYQIAYSNSSGEVWDCTAAWTSDACTEQTAFKNSKARALTGCKALFHKVEGAKIAFTADVGDEVAAIMGSAFDAELVTNDNYKKQLNSQVVWTK